MLVFEVTNKGIRNRYSIYPTAVIVMSDHFIIKGQTLMRKPTSETLKLIACFAILCTFEPW